MDAIIFAYSSEFYAINVRENGSGSWYSDTYIILGNDYIHTYSVGGFDPVEEIIFIEGT